MLPGHSFVLGPCRCAQAVCTRRVVKADLGCLKGCCCINAVLDAYTPGQIERWHPAAQGNEMKEQDS